LLYPYKTIKSAKAVAGNIKISKKEWIKRQGGDDKEMLGNPNPKDGWENNNSNN
jgi:hypothetical protein